jgi:hypothetical protein
MPINATSMVRVRRRHLRHLPTTKQDHGVGEVQGQSPVLLFGGMRAHTHEDTRDRCRGGMRRK